jgi:hypothetical protein
LRTRAVTDFENFLLYTSIQVYQSELWKGKVVLIQYTAAENQKAADKARRYLPWKGAIRIGDRKVLVLQKDITRANKEAAKAEREAKMAVQEAKMAAQEAEKSVQSLKRTRKQKTVAAKEEEELEGEEVEITLTSQSGRLSKLQKRRAIPSKEDKATRKVRLKLGLDPRDKEFRPAWEHDPLLLDPWDTLDKLATDLFLLQEEYIQF